jgi:hypothetical protein
MPGIVKKIYRLIQNGDELKNLIPELNYTESEVNNQGVITVAASSSENLPLLFTNIELQILEIWVKKVDEGKVNVNTNGNSVDLPLSPFNIFSGDDLTGVVLENTSVADVNVYWSALYA